jgi:hypothetical protein
VETVLIDDHPTPVSMLIQPSDSDAFILWTAAFRVWPFQKRDGLAYLLERSICDSSYGLVSNVHDAVFVGQDKQVHEGEPQGRVFSDARFVDAAEDFGVH